MTVLFLNTEYAKCIKKEKKKSAIHKKSTKHLTVDSNNDSIYTWNKRAYRLLLGGRKNNFFVYTSDTVGDEGAIYWSRRLKYQEGNEWNGII